tara:strand:+ start:7557 stop:7730 length:174 start_codon:yes stop_codon:yes gene_type:complete
MNGSITYNDEWKQRQRDAIAELFSRRHEEGLFRHCREFIHSRVHQLRLRARYERGEF